MELAHLVTGQVMLVSTFLSIAYLSEVKYLTDLLNKFTTFKHIRIVDEKGVILLLIVICTGIVFALDCIASQASLIKAKETTTVIKKSKILLMQNINVLFVTFICAYIFRSVTRQVYNLSGLAIFFMLVNTAFKIGRVKVLATWGYLGFFICNFFIFCLTFVARFDIYLKFISSFIMRSH